MILGFVQEFVAEYRQSAKMYFKLLGLADLPGFPISPLLNNECTIFVYTCPDASVFVYEGHDVTNSLPRPEFPIVCSSGHDSEIWGAGEFTAKLVAEFAQPGIGPRISISEVELDAETLVLSLTLGGVRPLVVHDAPYGFHSKIYRLNFRNELSNKYRFLEWSGIIPYSDACQWKRQLVHLLADQEFRHDYESSLSAFRGQFADSEDGNTPDSDQIVKAIRKTISEFRRLLRASPEGNENVFHSFLIAHPELLDLHAKSVPKPRWRYPDGITSAVGKSYVEPDFVLSYIGDRYKLVELEKPSKQIKTKVGRPHSDLTQPVHQIGEWRDFIRLHYSCLREKFPNIRPDCPGEIIISRETSSNLRESDWGQYRAQLAQMYSNIAVLTYDELLSHCERMLAVLETISRRRVSEVKE